MKATRRSQSIAPSYDLALKRVLRQIHPNLKLSKKATSSLNSLLNDTFDRITGEVVKLMRKDKKVTLSALEIQTAVKMLFGGEFAQHAMAEGTKAVTKYDSMA